ncbi:MAG: YtxH domain-containing protein [Deltaproteobacteria bacterium]
MIVRSSRFTSGLIIGGLLGATVGAMNSKNASRMRRRITRASRNVMHRGNNIVGAIADWF